MLLSFFDRKAQYIKNHKYMNVPIADKDFLIAAMSCLLAK
jgi:hypothetical protein